MKGVFMKAKYMKILKRLIVLFIIFFSFNTTALANNKNKTIIIVTDCLDFSTIEKLNFSFDISIGLMNTRTSNVFSNDSESYFMTIATGRRVKLEDGLFKGIKEHIDHSLIIKGYDEIIDSLDRSYINFSKEMEFLSDTLEENGIGVGYIGNDSSALLAANKKGIIHYGYTNAIYETDWLAKKTNELFSKIDVLILSYSIDENIDRLKTFEEYINRFHENNIVIFPSKTSGDVKDLRNKTLVPILYHNPNHNPGILTSNSTKREGIITNMDIFPEVASIYNIHISTSTGHQIYSRGNLTSKHDLIEKNKNILNKTLNLVVIKYIFHGIVICTQLYIFYDMYRSKEKLHNRINRYNLFMNKIITYIFLSLLLGIFIPAGNIIIYCLIILLLANMIVVYIDKRNHNFFEFLPILTNILLITATYLKPELIYHSFFGFNNIITGGRFYGLNNESAAILLATAITTFFWLKNKIKSKASTLIILISYFSVIILALSDKYAANFGGFLTSIAIFIMLIYATLFDKKIDKKCIIEFVCLGLLVLFIGLSIELNNDPKGHIGALFVRIKALGIYELTDIILKKMQQLLLITILPPWCIIFFGQLHFIKNFLLKEKKLMEKAKIKHLEPQLLIMFISSIIIFALNDTGVIAFVYMNTYLIKNIIHIKNMCELQ